MTYTAGVKVVDGSNEWPYLILISDSCSFVGNFLRVPRSEQKLLWVGDAVIGVSQSGNVGGYIRAIVENLLESQKETTVMGVVDTISRSLTRTNLGRANVALIVGGLQDGELKLFGISYNPIDNIVVNEGDKFFFGSGSVPVTKRLRIYPNEAPNSNDNLPEGLRKMFSLAELASSDPYVDPNYSYALVTPDCGSSVLYPPCTIV